MPLHGGFSSLGVSLASDHKAAQEELGISHSGLSLCMVFSHIYGISYKQVAQGVGIAQWLEHRTPD